MGFSNQTNSRMILASMKTIKEGEQQVPYFIIKDKVNGEWVEKDRFKNFTGHPYDIELGEYTWKNAPVDTVKMLLMDGQDKVQLEFNLDNGLSRSLLNTLLGESHIGELSMSLYVNAKGYPAIGIENDGNKTQWKYKFEEFPVVQKNAKGVVIDNAEYLEFMKKMVADIKLKLNGQPDISQKITPNPAAGKKEKTSEQAPDKVYDDHQELPF